MTGAGDLLLEASGVAVRFGGVKALAGIDFSLRHRELRCLIGPNGAGKTTFFKCLTGRLRPTQGTIRYKGTELPGLPSFKISRLGIGIKTQVPSLFDHLTAHEHAWLALRTISSSARREQAVQAVFERVGIGDLDPVKVGQMAHGQRQLVELAMILAADPELILLDEPAAGMTRQESARLVEIIREMNTTHSVIVVEHDMDFVRQLACGITVFNRGTILMQGSADEVLAAPEVRSVYLGDADV